MPDVSMVDVSIVIVSFNTKELLRACLASVFACPDVATEVIVVDNRSADGSPAMVETEFPRAILIRNDENRGFAAANNVAIRRAAGRHVLLLNPDTVLPGPTLGAMVKYLDGHLETGICGPRILYPDGRFQSCGYDFPTLLSEVRQSKHVNGILRAFIGNEPKRVVGGEPCEADWVDGACLMIRKQAIDQIGLLDEQYFLYGEELDWCYRARQAGWKIISLPDVKMVHYQGQSSGQCEDSSLGYLIETRLRFYYKNYGTTRALLIGLIYLLGCLKQIRHEPVKSKVKLRAVVRWLGMTCGMSRRVGRPTASQT